MSGILITQTVNGLSDFTGDRAATIRVILIIETCVDPALVIRTPCSGILITPWGGTQWNPAVVKRALGQSNEMQCNGVVLCVSKICKSHFAEIPFRFFG